MLGPGQEADGEPVPPFDAGTVMGRRHTDPEETNEVLCAKAGAGSLSVGETPLEIKSPRALPASG
jgi:hypothetical protein